MYSNGFILSFIAYLSFSFMDVINKFIFATVSIDFFSYMLWLDLAIIFALIMFGIANHNFSLQFFKTNNYKPILLRSVISVGNTLCSLVAISHLPFHLFYILAFMQPIIASCLSIIFNMERLKMGKILLIILGFVGVLVSIKIWDFNSNHIAIFAIAAGLGIALTGALSGIVVKKYMVTDNAITIAIYNILLSILVACGYFIISTKHIFIPNLHVATMILGAGTACAAGIVFFMKSYQTGEVQTISQLQYTQIIWGTFFGYLIFHEIPSLYSVLGAVIIIVVNTLNLKTEQ